MTPSWIFDLLAAVMLVVAAVSAARLTLARSLRQGTDVAAVDAAQLLIAIAMAGMLISDLRTFPDAVWEAIFGVLIAWFALRVAWDARVNGIRALGNGHCAPHLVHSGSMLYMFAATTVMGGMAGMSMPGMNELPGSSGSAMITLDYPTLAFVFTLILIGYTVWDLNQLAASRVSARLPRAGIGAPRIPAMASAESVTALPASPRTPAPAPVPVPGPASGASRDPAAESAGSGSAGGAARRPVAELLLAPAVTVGSRVTMGVVMACLLIIAI